jgi:hypothetical protein
MQRKHTSSSRGSRISPSRRVQGFDYLSIILRPRPVKPETVRRISLPRIEFIEEGLAPIERLVKFVVRRTVHKLDKVYAHRLNEAVSDRALNEGPNRIEESKDICKDNSYWRS